MDLLKRELAPISDDAWEHIEVLRSRHLDRLPQP